MPLGEKNPPAADFAVVADTLFARRQLLMAFLLQVEREIINHSCLIHPHIVRFRECFLTPKYLGIAMEYAAGGDLYKFVAAK